MTWMAWFSIVACVLAACSMVPTVVTATTIAVKTGGGGILDTMVHGSEAFRLGQYGNETALFRHPHRMVDIRLDDVADWILRNPNDVELLDRNGARRLGGQGWKALDKFYEEFSNGASSVINNLQSYDAASRRFADSFALGARYPVDVYMYLTPPHSQSYNYHDDVMDAWIVQLHGEKHWSVCGRFVTTTTRYDPTACTNYTLRHGDVMFVPFNTVHYVWTASELSAHLTVNVERQHFVWGSVIVSGLRYRACGGSRESLAKFVHLEGRKGEGQDSEVEEHVVALFRSIPELSMAWQTPEVGADWIARSAHNDDHPTPEALFERLSQEYLTLLNKARAISGTKKVRFRQPQGCEAVSELFSDPREPIEELRFVADAMRLKASAAYEATPSAAFSSVALRRASKQKAVQSGLKPPPDRFVRGAARVVLFQESGDADVVLLVGRDRKVVPKGLAKAAKFATAAVLDYGAFTEEQLRSTTRAPKTGLSVLLQNLLYRGVLQLQSSAGAGVEKMEL